MAERSECLYPASIHLDPLGGIAGDMFIAAILDAWPDLRATVDAAVAACDMPPGWSVKLSRRKSAFIEGNHFDVIGPAHERGRAHRHGHGHGHGQDEGGEPVHAMGRYADVAARIDAMALPAAAKDHAQGIYRRLAECEAKVHGIEVAEVHFHELADWDSLIDIVATGSLLAALAPERWTVGSVPLGSGQVRTAHGPLPVPAPATTRLLAGFNVHDDGIAGERVTPTGAAILAHLQPALGRRALRGRMGVSGIGVGTRQLPGLANILRVTAFHEIDAQSDVLTDQVGLIEFDVDDLTPEELANALDCLRAMPGVIDVLSRQAYGKKSRHVFEVRLLVEPAAQAAVELACFEQTTTLGLRSALATRRLLARQTIATGAGYKGTPDGTIAVKIAHRPGGVTAKAEHDDIARTGGVLAPRRRLAEAAQREALQQYEEEHGD